MSEDQIKKIEDWYQEQLKELDPEDDMYQMSKSGIQRERNNKIQALKDGKNPFPEKPDGSKFECAGCGS